MLARASPKTFISQIHIR